MSIPTIDVPYRYTLHGSRLAISPNALKALNEIGLNEETDWVTYTSGEQVRKGTTSCFKVPLNNGCDYVYFKRYKIRKNPWEFFLRRSKAANELINYQRLKDIGIPTLDVIAFYEKRKFGRLDTACIVTKEIKNSLEMELFAKSVWAKMPSNEKNDVLSDLSTKLFAQLRKAHNAKFFHRDLKWRNVLIQKTDDGYFPVWIDCPRGLIMRLRWRRGIVFDLSALARVAIRYFSYTDQLRLLKKYLGENKKHIDCKKLFKDIAIHLAKRPPS